MRIRLKYQYTCSRHGAAAMGLVWLGPFGTLEEACNDNLYIFTAYISLVGESKLISVSEEPAMGLKVHMHGFILGNYKIKVQTVLCYDYNYTSSDHLQIKLHKFDLLYNS